IHPQPEVAESRHEITGAAVGITGNSSNETANEEPRAHCYRNLALVIDLQPRENPTVLELGELRQLSIGSMEEDICRICHGNRDVEELVRVCRCKGTTKYAHKSCVLRWFKMTYRFHCELCQYKMKIKKEGRKPLKEWRYPCDLGSFLSFLAVFTVHILHGIVLVLIITIAVMKKCFTVTCITLILLCFAIMVMIFFFCDGCGYLKYCKRQWTANEICSHLSDKASKDRFLKPDELQNHINEGK
ncbi:unnamed protein product, partial [Porites evermanni]